MPVQVLCPGCGFANTFWGKTDSDGKVIEHYGRRCQGMLEDDEHKQQCDFRFRFKECEQCGAENDIAARACHSCLAPLVDPDDKLRDALNLKNALVIRCAGQIFSKSKSGLKVIYYDEDGTEVIEYFSLKSAKAIAFFKRLFILPGSDSNIDFSNLDSIIEMQSVLRHPDFVIAKKEKKGIKVIDRLFDYQGRYRKANALN